MLELYDWQQADLDEAADHDSWFLAYGMGLGKTLVAVEWTKVKEAETIIVILPLNTRKSWERTFNSQRPDMPVHRIGTVKKAEVQAVARLANGERGVYLIGWELMRTGALTGQYADLIIADETHRQQNYGVSDTAKMIRMIDSKYKIALSGTPAANKPEGIFSTLNWLWPKLFKSYHKWIEDYWRTRRNGAVIDLIRELTPNGVINSIPMFTRRLRKDHRKDMPDVLPEIPVEVELSASQRKIYDRLSKEAGVWLGDDFISTAVPLVEDIRLRQIALGNPIVAADGTVSYNVNASSSKIAALLDIISDQPQEDTFLVLVHSAKFIPVVVEQLRKKKIDARGFWGDTPTNEREWLIDNLGSGYRVLVAGIAAIGEGTDGLQRVCHNMVWLSKHPNAMLNTQAAERLDRPGQTEPVNVWNIYAVDTVDIRTLERLDEIKENLADMLDNRG